MKFSEIKKWVEDIEGGIIDAVPQNKRPLAKVVLGKSRDLILDVVKRNLGGRGGLTVEKLDKICLDLDETKLTHTETVLEKVGLSGLEGVILDYRKTFRWQFINAKLEGLLEAGQPFTPNDIRRLDSKLYNSLKKALVAELDEEEGLDWESLRSKLPEGLARCFEVESVSKEQRRILLEEAARHDIQAFDLTEAVAVLKDDPRKLSVFLDLIGLQADEDRRGRMVAVSFTGVRNEEARRIHKVMAKCKPRMGEVEILNRVPRETNEKTVTLKIRVPKGAKELMIRGPWSRNIKVNGQRDIEIEIPLSIGKKNEIQLVAHNYNFDKPSKRAKRSEMITVKVDQLSPDDTDILSELLELISVDKIEELKGDKNRSKFFVKTLEEMTIKHFAGNFDEGVEYLEKLIAKHSERGANFVVQCLNEVLSLFEKINEKQYPFLRESDEHGNPVDLAFFQKYCIHKVLETFEAGNDAIIANEPGLGKTITALAIALAMGAEVIIVCPNQAASTWMEEMRKFIKEPFLVNAAGAGTRNGKKIIGERDVPGVVVNVEFIRSKGTNGDKAKFKVVNTRFGDGKRPRLLIVDEAHFLKNNSDQSNGFSEIERDHTLLLTATPWRSAPAVRSVMSKLLPDDTRFQSARAFNKAFPSNDPAKMKALYVWMQDFVIRFLKSDVMPTLDPTLPLDEQVGLPAKELVNPISTGIGRYTLTRAQQEAILLFFEDWQEFNRQYEKFLPRGKQAKEDRLRRPDDSLSKMHALKYIMSHPKYVGSKEESPKDKEAMRIIDKVVSGGKKMMVMCRYQSRVEDYVRMLNEKGIEHVAYYGEVKRGEGTNNKGYKISPSGRVMRYELDEKGSYVLRKGKPVVAAEDNSRAAPILGLDYNRLIFQNDPETKVVVCTYSTAATSVTFTAADAYLEDDLPVDATEENQAHDRIHRMDFLRKRFKSFYYRLVGAYSDDFLEDMEFHDTYDSEGDLADENAYERWFEQGTYDEVHILRLVVQRFYFDILNNGISIDSELEDKGPEFKFN